MLGQNKVWNDLGSTGVAIRLMEACLNVARFVLRCEAGPVAIQIKETFVIELTCRQTKDCSASLAELRFNLG